MKTATLAILLALPAVAAADPITISGTGPLGSFSGVLNYTPTSSSTGVVDIALTNTSPAANGGYLTAFAFNLPAAASVTSATITTDREHFELLGAPAFDDGVSANPFGLFDIGASTGQSFSGGGAPHRGAGVGETASFSFQLTGTGLGGLSSADFLNTLSAPHGSDARANFVVRFRGFTNGGGDKVPNGVSP
jgi:hypothetical protein